MIINLLARKVGAYAYDKASNLKNITLPDGKQYVFTYDQSNRLTKTQYPEGYSNEYVYDVSGGANNGQITTFKETLNSITESTSYSYNTLNMLTRLEGSGGYTSWLYDEDSFPVQMQLGDKTTLYQNFKDNGLLSNQKYNTLNLNYNYDADGILISYNDGTSTQSYSYDFANRLTTWNNGTSTVTYNYDKAGNLLNPSGKTLTFNAANEINGYIYDDAGNLVQDDKNIYEWNELGQLMTVKKLDGIVVASYTYYPNGLRKTKIVGTTIENYYYNGNKLVRVTDGSGATKWKITWGNDKPMILSTGEGATYYYVTNYRGDVVQIVDSNGAKVANYSYDPWGNVLNTNETASLIGQPLGYASYVYDRETTMYYLQARYYKPSDGVFLSRDPVSGTLDDPMTQNGYSHANGNPITYVDPVGLFSIKIGVKFAGAAITIALGALAGGGVGAIQAFILRKGKKEAARLFTRTVTSKLKAWGAKKLATSVSLAVTFSMEYFNIGDRIAKKLDSMDKKPKNGWIDIY